MILLTFVLIFIVFYLYYTIVDVKKMNQELLKLGKEVQSLSSGFATLSKEVLSLRNAALPAPACCFRPGAVPAEQNLVIDDEDEDEDEVSSEDLKKIINDADSEDEGDAAASVQDEDVESDVPIDKVHNDADAPVEETESTLEKPLSAEDLKKMKYDEIKELCKQKGVTVKGSKDVLVEKLEKLLLSSA